MHSYSYGFTSMIRCDARGEAALLPPLPAVLGTQSSWLEPAMRLAQATALLAACASADLTDQIERRRAQFALPADCDLTTLTPITEDVNRACCSAESPCSNGEPPRVCPSGDCAYAVAELRADPCADALEHLLDEAGGGPANGFSEALAALENSCDQRSDAELIAAARARCAGGAGAANFGHRLQEMDRAALLAQLVACRVPEDPPPPPLAGMVMRSGYNGALVQVVVYTGEATALSWELQHSLCAAAGRATPGSDLSYRRYPFNWLDKYCAYSTADNYVVTDRCTWRDQEFTHVSGSLGGGVGYMCASSGCDYQVRVQGTTAAYHGGQPTLNSGDAVFCSA